MRKELEEVDRTHAKQFNLWYTLDRPPVGKVPVVPTVGQLQPLTQSGASPWVGWFWAGWLRPWTMSLLGKCRNLRERGFGMTCL